jgi:UDP-glucose 4-epimerase
MTVPFKRALVTGGAGFIGSHLTETLVSEGCQVVVLDNFATGHRSNLDAVTGSVELVEGDIRDYNTVRQATEGCEAVFHLAAMVSVPQTVEQPLESAAVNDMGTMHVLEAARGGGVTSLVFASSSAVYGDDPDLPKSEEMIPKPLSPYAVQKISGEYYTRLYHQLYGMQTTSLRFFNVYGPKQDPSSPYSGVISIFMSQAVQKRPPTIYGDGTQSRDFVYVADVVRALVKAASAEAASGRSINVGTGISIDINYLWKIIADMAGLTIKSRYAPQRTGDIVASVAAIGSSKTLLGFEPTVAFEKGLEKTFRWYTVACS